MMMMMGWIMTELEFDRVHVGGGGGGLIRCTSIWSSHQNEWRCEPYKIN